MYYIQIRFNSAPRMCVIIPLADGVHFNLKFKLKLVAIIMMTESDVTVAATG